MASRSRDQAESGAPDLAIVATADGVAGDRGRRVHHQPRRRGAGAGQPGAPADGARGRGRPQLGQRQRGHRRAGRRDARRMCELTAHGARVRARPTCSCARPGSSAIPMPMAPIETGIPALATRLDARTAAAPRRRRDPDHRHRAARRPRVSVELPTASTATVGGMAKGAAMLSPAMATMLAVRHHRRGRRAACPAARRCTIAVDGELQPAGGRRCTQHQRHRARARERAAGNAPIDRRRPASRTTRSATRCTEVCASLAEQMAPDAEGATKCAAHHGARRPHRRRSARRGPRRWRAASSCSARCTARTRTGVGCSPSSARAARTSIRSRSTSPTTASPSCRDGVAAAHDDDALVASDAAARDRDRRASCTAGRRGDGALHRSHPRLHRREHGHVMTPTSRRRSAASGRPRDDDKARDPRRGAAVHPGVQRPDRRHQVRRPRDGRPGARRPVRAGRRADAPRRA